MKLQSLSRLALQSQEMETVKGGKRLYSFTSLEIKSIPGTTVKLPPIPINCTISKTTLGKNIDIEWITCH